jgi:hypothetical protein
MPGWATTLRSNWSLVRASAGTAYEGVKGAWSSGMAGKGARDLLLGDKRMALYGAGGAVAGAGFGAAAGGRDHRVSGAVTGGLLGAGAGIGGRLGYNNRAGLRNMFAGGRRGFSRGMQRLDQAMEDLRYSRDYEL